MSAPVTLAEIEAIEQMHLAANHIQMQQGWQYAYDCIDTLLRAIAERDASAEEQECEQLRQTSADFARKNEQLRNDLASIGRALNRNPSDILASIRENQAELCEYEKQLRAATTKCIDLDLCIRERDQQLEGLRQQLAEERELHQARNKEWQKASVDMANKLLEVTAERDQLHHDAIERDAKLMAWITKPSPITKPPLSERDRQRCSEVAESLSEAFCFDQSPQGYEYWDAVRNQLRNLAGDLA